MLSLLRRQSLLGSSWSASVVGSNDARGWVQCLQRREIAVADPGAADAEVSQVTTDGTGQRRISFGGGWYASPSWSPDGQWIAFTRRGADGRRIGVVRPDGTGEKLLTAGSGDEGPGWAPSSREILFQRTAADGRTGLYRIALDGGEPRAMAIPQDGSDPDWSGVMD